MIRVKRLSDEFIFESGDDEDAIESIEFNEYHVKVVLRDYDGCLICARYGNKLDELLEGQEEGELL